MILVLHVKPVPDTHVSADADVLQPPTANAVGDAELPVTLARTVLAACAARSDVVTNPVAVRAPVIVGLAIEGDVARTIPPVPVTLFPRAEATPVPKAVTPVPPFAAVRGFCRVTLLKVGDGYVCAMARAGASKARTSSFFIVNNVN